MTAADFEVLDSGQIQTLDPLHEEEAPVDVVLVLDTSGSVDGPKLAALREAAGAFLEGLRQGAGDLDADPRGERAALLAFQEEVRLVEPLTTVLDRVHRAVQTVTARGSTSLVDATYGGLRLLAPGARRNVVVVFSDGLDSMSWLTPDQVVEAAARSDSIVHAVVARGKGDPENAFLREVTRATGGRVWTTRSQKHLRRRFLDVLEDIRSRYVLRYPPDGVDHPGWHPLEVRLKNRRGEVLARPGYYRPTLLSPGTAPGE